MKGACEIVWFFGEINHLVKKRIKKNRYFLISAFSF